MNRLKKLLCALLLALAPAYCLGAHNHIQQMIDENPALVIEFMRDGCSYCQYLTPLFNETAAHFAGKPITFKIINNNTMDKATKDYFQLKTYPTVIYYKNGKEHKRHGSNDKKMTVAEIKHNIESIYLS